MLVFIFVFMLETPAPAPVAVTMTSTITSIMFMKSMVMSPKRIGTAKNENKPGKEEIGLMRLKFGDVQER